jgi:endonuclease/exonuclease/phosphatase family metal-dependent hydrolase
MIKVLSYNIHKGFSLANRNFVLKNIKDSIKELQPDVLFLQEVVGSHVSSKHVIEDWPTKAQFEYLASELYEYYVYGRNAIYKNGDHGNAILSKLPVIYSENINISTNRLEKRGILHSIVKYQNKNIHTFCLHLNLLESGRKIQVNKLKEIIKEKVNNSSPVIIAGDFNDWKVKVSIELEKSLELKDAYFDYYGEYAKTFPSPRPFLCLDRIYYRNIYLEYIETLKWKKLSDHLALFAHFSL